jgi:general secretion pathway protein L
MAQTVIGLDIGATSIKMMRLEASLFRFEFMDFSEHPLPMNVDLPWEQLVSNVLQVLFSDRGMKADRLVASLPGQSVSARILTLPFIERRKIDQTLPFEIEGLIPQPLEDVLLDYEVLEKTPEGAKVLVLITEKRLLESYLGLLKEAGIDPNVILPSSVALANLWKEISASDQEPFALVDFGETETSLCVVHDGGLRYGRAWALGSRALTQAIQDGLEISPPLARDKKEKEANLHPAPTPGGDSEPEWIATLLRKALVPLVGGVRQSLLSVSKSLDLTVRKIYLCGKGSHLRGLDRLLAEELQVTVEPIALRGPVGGLLETQGQDPAAAATSLGLAYHAVREMASSRLNLRTGEYTYVSERAELKRQAFSLGIMAGILLLLALVHFGLQYRFRSQEYQRLSRHLDEVALEIFPELRSVPAGAQRTSAITSRLDQERRERDLFAPLSTDSLSVLDILLEITNAVPQDVKIDVRELVVEGGKVRVEAETDSYNAAEQIKQNLLSTGMFAKADIPEAKDSLDQASVKFKMMLELTERFL